MQTHNIHIKCNLKFDIIYIYSHDVDNIMIINIYIYYAKKGFTRNFRVHSIPMDNHTSG